MTNALFWLFNTTGGWIVLAALITPGLIYFLRAASQNVKRDASADQMAHRDLVARSIERGDYLVMADQDFKGWLEANEGFIYQHETEAMVRARSARVEKKPEKQPDRNQPADRLHPYNN